MQEGLKMRQGRFVPVNRVKLFVVVELKKLENSIRMAQTKERHF
jgi:hypothetical protein